MRFSGTWRTQAKQRKAKARLLEQRTAGSPAVKATPGLQLVPASAVQPGPKYAWFKFFPSDWRGDELLAACSFGARGLLVELLGLMHTAEPRGYLLVNGSQPPDAELARLVRATSVSEMRRLRAELIARGVLSTSAEGVIYSRRMVRDTARSVEGRETGKRGGNPRLKLRTVTLNGLAPVDPGADNIQKLVPWIRDS